MLRGPGKKYSENESKRLRCEILFEIISTDRFNQLQDLGFTTINVSLKE